MPPQPAIAQEKAAAAQAALRLAQVDAAGPRADVGSQRGKRKACEVSESHIKVGKGGGIWMIFDG